MEQRLARNDISMVVTGFAGLVWRCGDLGEDVVLVPPGRTREWSCCTHHLSVPAA